MEKYDWMVKRLEEESVYFLYQHCSNSAGIIDVPEANKDMVRAGIAMYGLYPSQDVDQSRIHLKPALELKSHVAFVKTIHAGTPVSYGGTYVAKQDTIVATIPIGYGDGYPRSLSYSGNPLWFLFKIIYLFYNSPALNIYSWNTLSKIAYEFIVKPAGTCVSCGRSIDEKSK